MDKIPLVIIVGPTAVGKTACAIELAKKLDGEIISADSMQIYKYMDIGTAKPTEEEKQGIPHHMMDFLDPSVDFSVAQFQQMAQEIIHQIHQRGKIPIVVGGTGLYVNSLIYPMNFTDACMDQEYRQKMQELAMEKGNAFLHGMLRECDPETAERLHPNDLRRIIRALEVYHLTGKTMSQFKQDFAQLESPYRLCMIGLTMNREKLYERINQRVDQMIQNGLVKEVRFLMDMGYKRDMISMQGLGYKEMFQYLEGELSLEEATEIIKRDTRRFAKRQYTWFRRDKRIKWVDVEKFNSKEELTKHLLGLVNESVELNEKH